MLKKLLKSNPNPNNLNFYQAIQSGNLKVAKHLYEQDSTLLSKRFTKEEDEGTPVIYAAKCGQLEIVKWLVQEGASLTEKDKKGNTAFLTAIWFQKRSVADFLLSYNIEVIADRGEYNTTAIDVAKSFERSLGSDFISILNDRLKEYKEYKERPTLPAVSPPPKENKQLLQSAIVSFSQPPATPTKSTLTIVQQLRKKVFSSESKPESGDTPLIQAVRKSNYEKVKLLLDSGSKAIEKTVNGTPAIILAILQGSIPICKLIIDKDQACINESDNLKETALMCAIRRDFDFSFIQYLVNHGATVNAQNSTGQTALDIAKAYSRTLVIEYLEKNGGTCSSHVLEKILLDSQQSDSKQLDDRQDNNAELLEAASTGQLEKLIKIWKKGRSERVHDERDYTALMLTIEKGHVKLTQWILENSVIDTYHRIYSALTFAVKRKNFGAVQAIINKGALSDKTVLKSAAETGDMGIVELLLDNNNSIINSSCSDGSAIVDAVTNKHIQVAAALLRRGASIRDRDESGKSLLQLAAKNEDSEMIRLLVSYDASISEVDKDGDTVLTFSASKGYTKAVATLLEMKSSLQETNKSGRTSLLLAAENGHVETVKFLISVGASVEEETATGDTALLLAAFNGHINVVETLLDNKASIKKRDKYGNSAMLLAAGGGMLAVMQILLKRGASLIEVDNYGHTSLLRAAQYDQLDVVKWLLENGASRTEKRNDGRSLTDLAVGKVREFLLQSSAEAESTPPIDQQIDISQLSRDVHKSMSIAFDKNIATTSSTLSNGETNPQEPKSVGDIPVSTSDTCPIDLGHNFFLKEPGVAPKLAPMPSYYVTSSGEKLSTSSQDLVPSRFNVEEINYLIQSFPDMKQQIIELRQQSLDIPKEQFRELVTGFSKVSIKVGELEQKSLALDKELDRDPIAQAERKMIADDRILFSYYQTLRKLHYQFLAAHVISSGLVSQADDNFDLFVKGTAQLGQAIPGIGILTIILEKSISVLHGIQKRTAMRRLAEWVPNTSSGECLAETFARCATLGKRNAIWASSASLERHGKNSWIDAVYSKSKALYESAKSLKEEVLEGTRTAEYKLALADSFEVVEAIMTGKIEASQSKQGREQTDDHLYRMLSVLDDVEVTRSKEYSSVISPVRSLTESLTIELPTSGFSSVSDASLSPVSTEEFKALQIELLKMKEEKEKREAEQEHRIAQLIKDNEAHKEKFKKLDLSDNEVYFSGDDSMQVQLNASMKASGRRSNGNKGLEFQQEFFEAKRQIATQQHYLIHMVEQLTKKGIIEVPREENQQPMQPDIRCELFSLQDDDRSPIATSSMSSPIITDANKASARPLASDKDLASASVGSRGRNSIWVKNINTLSSSSVDNPQSIAPFRANGN